MSVKDTYYWKGYETGAINERARIIRLLATHLRENPAIAGVAVSIALIKGEEA